MSYLPRTKRPTTVPLEVHRGSNTRRTSLATGFMALSAAALLPNLSFATDGVIELNQTCALELGCVLGDSPGFPIEIDGVEGRSYRLTGDLVVPDENTTAIRIYVKGTTIDLNGFTIRGVTNCSGVVHNNTCSPTGTGFGIRSTAPQTSVQNGHIIGMGTTGLQLHGHSLIDGVMVSENGLDGISVGIGSHIIHSASAGNNRDGFYLRSGSVAENCTANGNGQDGFDLESAVRVHHSVARSNTASGFRAYQFEQASIQDNTAIANGQSGILVGSWATVRNNSIGKSGLAGILAGDGSVIEGNMVRDSGTFGIRTQEASVVNNNSVSDSALGGITAGVASSIRGNAVLRNGTTSSHHGIYCTLGCRVQDNTVRENTGFGIRFNSNSSGYSGNTIGVNGAGTVSFGRDTGSNVCETSTSCP